MIYTISRPPTDDHTFPMFQQLIKNLTAEFEGYYIWSNPPGRVLQLLDNIKINKPIVVIAIKDLLDGWEEFNYWTSTQQIISAKLSEVANKHRNTKFIIFTSLENLQLEINEPNIDIIPWGGDLVNQEIPYKELKPVADKNFDSEKPFICLNRNNRDHRIVVMSYILGQNIDQYGYVSYLSNQQKGPSRPDDFLDRICWEFDEPRHTDAKNIMLDGYKKLLKFNQEDSEEYEIYNHYGRKTNDNATNFDVHLRPRYRNSFVEIVSESSFCTPSFNITEKTANAFFGFNFPIILGGAGIIEHLRTVGLDVFDDVVDHSYDTMTNPFDRVIAAIDNNRRLLTDADYTKQKWKECQPRFESNFEIIRNIYDWYDARTQRLFNEVIQKIC